MNAKLPPGVIPKSRVFTSGARNLPAAEPAGWESLPAAYNIVVARPQRESDSGNKHRHAIYATETSGLLIIAFLILVLIVVRYWHAIHWSWR